MNLRKAARGKPCLVRGPTCNYDPETTVLAHIRRGGAGGMGMKPHDLIAVRACSACHDAIDRRNGSASDGEILDALCRTLDAYAREGLIEPFGRHGREQRLVHRGGGLP